MLRRLKNDQPGLADENTDNQIWTGGFHEPAKGYVLSLGFGNIHAVGGSLITPYATGVSNC
jgi:ABC-type cobalt transport system substrate-binding protein